MANCFLMIETATDACSVAICYKEQIEFFHHIEPKRHSELLLPHIDLLLKKVGISLLDLDCIIVGEGPGSFTGLRMGLSVAQGLCLATERDARQISTLKALALSSLAYPLNVNNSIIVALDARMGEVYAQRFEVENNILISCVEPCLGPLDRVLDYLLQDGDVDMLGVGNGFLAYADAWQAYKLQFQKIDETCLPHAGKLSHHLLHYVEYAKLVDNFSELVPVYLRDKVV